MSYLKVKCIKTIAKGQEIYCFGVYAKRKYVV